MIFSFFASFNSTACICRKSNFETLINSPAVASLIADFRAGNAEAKKALPGVCYQASFPHGKRKSKEAVPSGTAMVDFDNMSAEELRKLIERAIPPPEKRDTSPVLLVHITPSGKGLRVVIKATRQPEYADCRSLADYQRRLAQLIGGEQWLDTVCHDLARYSFVPQASDVLYLSDRLFDEAPEVTEFAESTTVSQSTLFPAPAPAATAPATPTSEEEVQNTFDGISLKEIFEAYFNLTGGMPQKGMRNSRYYAAARDLRYICDFNPRVMMVHMPDCGLSSAEVFQVCSSACTSCRASTVPDTVVRAIELAKNLNTTEDAETEEMERDKATRIDFALPVLAREFVEQAPRDFKQVTLLALLPIVGTLATRLRADYLDGEEHSPSFFTVISADQASGKSFARRIVKKLLAPIFEEDARQRRIEQEYFEQLRLKKNAKDQPPAPRPKIRIIPASISLAKLLQRLDYAEGEHLFTFDEEMDTLIKSNRSGTWSQKSDLYRKAHDNTEYGQDYMSELSYSANLPVYYNLLVLGTPMQTLAFFDNVENGLVSRCLFGLIPDQFAMRMPIWKKMSAQTDAAIDGYVRKLREAGGKVDLSFLYPAIDAWLEKQRITTLTEVSRARDTFRKRAAVAGFRAALAFSPLYALDDKSSQQLLAEFCIGVADLVLRNQIAFAGERINNLQTDSPLARITPTENIFNALTDIFTIQDLSQEIRKRAMRSRPRELVYKWKRNGMIEKMPDKKYKKIYLTHGDHH